MVGFDYERDISGADVKGNIELTVTATGASESVEFGVAVNGDFEKACKIARQNINDIQKKCKVSPDEFFIAAEKIVRLNHKCPNKLSCNEQCGNYDECIEEINIYKGIIRDCFGLEEKG